MNRLTGRTTRHGAKKPKVLKGKDIPSLAKYIKSDGCKNIVLMLGAGVSTSAGIPDFRSPGTGLYSNLARLNLPHPEAVFEISFFRRNPVPFYTLAHELYPGKFRPTIAHSFIRLLAEHSLLYQCFTQNIDTLERRAGVPDGKIIEAHGSFATQRCIDCEEPFDDEVMKQHIKDKKIATCEECGGLVKPDIVFFGESLPINFIRAIPLLQEADLLIVMGTSLTVQPFASLVERVDNSCPRVLINLDRVGSIGSRSDDVVLLGKCDDIVRDLCKELGWEDELLKLWHETEDTVEKEEGVDGKSELGTLVRADEEVENLTAAIEKSLALNETAVEPRSKQKDSALLSDSSIADPRDDGKLKIPAPLTPPPKDIQETTPETSPKLEGRPQEK